MSAEQTYFKGLIDLFKDFTIIYTAFNLSDGDFQKEVISLVAEDDRLRVELDTNYEYIKYENMALPLKSSPSNSQYILDTTHDNEQLHILGMVRWDEKIIAEHKLLGNENIIRLHNLNTYAGIVPLHVVAKYDLPASYIQNSMLDKDDFAHIEKQIHWLNHILIKEKGTE